MITAKFDASQSKNLLLQLKRLPINIQRKVLREESRRTAKTILLPVARKRVPKQTGILRKSIKVRSLKRSRVRTGVRIGYSAKDFVGDTFYGSFLEYGWRLGKRSADQLRAQSFFSKRAKRDRETGGLASKIGRKRDAKAESTNTAALKAPDKRRKIPGRYFLKSVVETHGEKARVVFLKLSAIRIEKELRWWRI